jgi:hypothetical protein
MRRRIKAYLRDAQAYMLISMPTGTSATAGAFHSAQAYMLISMPTGTSATFGAFQAMLFLHWLSDGGTMPPRSQPTHDRRSVKSMGAFGFAYSIPAEASFAGEDLQQIELARLLGFHDMPEPAARLVDACKRLGYAISRIGEGEAEIGRRTEPGSWRGGNTGVFK